MNLYTLSKTMQEFVSSIPEEMTEEQVAKMQNDYSAMSEDFEEKIENTIKYMRDQECKAKAIAEEIARLSDLKKSYDKKAAQMEHLIDTALKFAGVEKLSLSIAKISYRKSSCVIVDDAIVSDEYKKTKEVVTVDKTKIKEAIQSWIGVNGAYIQENKNIQIK